MAELHRLESCRETFKGLKILTVFALYIQAAIMYVDVDKNQPRNNVIHQHETRPADLYNFLTPPPEKNNIVCWQETYKNLPTKFLLKTGKSSKTVLNHWNFYRKFLNYDHQIVTDILPIDNIIKTMYICRYHL